MSSEAVEVILTLRSGKYQWSLRGVQVVLRCTISMPQISTIVTVMGRSSEEKSSRLRSSVPAHGVDERQLPQFATRDLFKSKKVFTWLELDNCKEVFDCLPTHSVCLVGGLVSCRLLLMYTTVTLPKVLMIGFC